MRIELKRRASGRIALTAATSLLLAGCQTLSPDGGTASVTAFASRELNKDAVAIRSEEDARAAKTSVTSLLRRPLTADAAVQIALLNNRGLQAAYNELGAAEAQTVRASLPPNPVLSLSRISGGGELEVERRIVADILALATLPARAEIASQRFRQAQLRAVAETLRVATEARRAYYRTVAARELTGFLTQAQSAAEAAAQLTKRLGETGALNKLDQAREQVFYADITTQVATAKQRAESERERLIRALGLWGADLDFKLAGALPALPRRVQTLPFVETEAVRRRVDLQIARIDVQMLAKSYGLTQATRFINLLEVGGVGKTTRDPDGSKIRERGIEVDFQIPLFDFGETRVREAEQTYMEAVNLLTQKAVNVRSEARDAYRIYRSAYDVASHYQREVLPLRKIISDETMLRYNAMQIDVFSLLAEARQRIAATSAAIEAHRDFWLAHTNLFVAIAAGSPGGEVASASSPAAAVSGEAAAH
ncbi:TolC family protein [Leptospira sp. severe_002]|uniref:TolC family protein n=1 Tax=Leptospira sp. severe_002 TaxID=2838237 RepID=UPI001E60D04A|nr:TolC family protein [Leptospira sp. severe_002]